MKRTRLQPYSPKTLAQMPEAMEILKQKCQDCGGIFVQTASYKGVWVKAICVDGKCAKCGRVRVLYAHEEPFRSRGGKLGKDSEWTCPTCHRHSHNVD